MSGPDLPTAKYSEDGPNREAFAESLSEYSK